MIGFINRNLGKDIKPTYAEPHSGEVKHFLANIEQAQQLLGYKVMIDFEKGLKTLI